MRPCRDRGPVQSRVQSQSLKWRLTHHVQHRVQRNILEMRRYLPIHRNGAWPRMPDWSVSILGSVRRFDGRNLQSRASRQPRAQRDLALHLSALPKVRSNRRDQQLPGIGMNTRIHSNACRNNPGSNVRPAVHMNAAVGAKLPGLARAVEIQRGYSFWRKRIAEDRVQHLHVQIARYPGLPVWMRKVLKRPRNLQRMFFVPMIVPMPLRVPRLGGDPHRAQGCRRPCQVNRCLHEPVYRLRFAPRQIQIGSPSLDAIALLAPRNRRPIRRCRGIRSSSRNIAQKQRNILCVEVERGEPVLKIERCGSVVVVQHALFHGNTPRFEIEQRIDCGFAGSGLFGRMRLVR